MKRKPKRPRCAGCGSTRYMYAGSHSTPKGTFCSVCVDVAKALFSAVFS